MRSLLKYVSILGVTATTLALTACSGQPDFDVTLDNGNELAIETDYIQLTNQEMFEFVAGGYVNWINPGVSIILDWADSIILSDLVEIDEDELQERFESRFINETSFDDIAFGEEADETEEEEAEEEEDGINEDDLQERLITEGFDSVDAYLANIRLEMMREQFVYDAVEISEEEIQERFDELFPLDEETDAIDEADDETNDEFEEVENEETFEDERPTLEDERENIEDFLRNEVLQDPTFERQTLANLRVESGLTIYSSYFATRYENFLDTWGVEDIDVTTGYNTNSVIASLENQALTTDELFTTVIAQFALGTPSQLLDHIDLNTLDEIYDTDLNVVRTNLNQAKINMNEWFFQQMEMRGLLTEQQIFDSFILSHLQELAFEDNITLSDERIQELHDEYVPNRDIQYILVGDYDVATDLIERLQDASDDDVLELFTEFITEYGGNDLGTLTIPTHMPQEFEVVAFDLEENQFTTTPVETELGYYIIFVSNIEPYPSLRRIRQNEMERLQNSPEHLANLMFDIRERHNIRFHNEQLQVQYDTIAVQTRRNVEEE